MTFNKKDVLN